jgi:hypothetical protein
VPSASTCCGGVQQKQNSHALAATINEQIVSAVEKELDAITTQARAAHTAIRTLFVQNVLKTREADKREFVFLSQLQAQPSISWVAFGWPDGAFFAAHKLGDLGLEMMEIAPVDGVVKRRIDKYQVVVGDIQFEKRRFEDSGYRVTEQEWYRSGIKSDEPAWFEVSAYPVGLRPSIAYVGQSTCTRSVKVCSRSSSKTRGSRSFCRNSPLARPARRSSWVATGPRSPRPIRMPMKSICSGRISRCCRLPGRARKSGEFVRQRQEDGVSDAVRLRRERVCSQFDAARFSRLDAGDGHP